MSSEELINISGTVEDTNQPRNVSLWRHPDQWSIFGFRFVPLFLFAVGTCCVIYGVLYHRIPVLEKRVEKYTVQVPDKKSPPQKPPGANPFEQPPELPPGLTLPSFESANIPFPPPEDNPPKMKSEEKTREVQVTTDELELAINQAITTGDLERNPAGMVARIFRGGSVAETGSGKGGPAPCPT
jgi:hypothetical protein